MLIVLAVRVTPAHVLVAMLADCRAESSRPAEASRAATRGEARSVAFVLQGEAWLWQIQDGAGELLDEVPVDLADLEEIILATATILRTRLADAPPN